MGEAPAEPDHSRAWLTAHGPGSRKNELAFAAVGRITRGSATATGTFGRPLTAADREATDGVVSDVLRQDRALAAHVARDAVLLFEAFGGLALNERHAIASVGLDPGWVGADPVAADALAIARVIRGRSQDLTPSTTDISGYEALFTTEGVRQLDRVLGVTGWAAIVIGRLHNHPECLGADALGNPPVLAPHLQKHGTMSDVGWYPNPVNGGDVSTGVAGIQRWWDGSDWSDRARVREGRRWTEHRIPLSTSPTN